MSGKLPNTAERREPQDTGRRRAASGPPPAILHEVRAGSSRRRDLAIFLVVVALACSLRQMYVVQLSHSPLFYHPELDELYHDEWARAITADEQFIDGPYFRAPLYPFFLAGIYKVFGHGYFTPRIVQGLIGSLSCGLLFLIGRLAFGRLVGAVAGLAAATYWVLIYFDGELLIPSLIVFLDLLLIWLLLRCADQPTWLRFAGAGLVLGLSAIARPNILLFGAAVMIWVWIRNRSRKQRALGFSLCFALGCVIPIAPVASRNLIVGQDAVLIASQGGLNFYIGNNPESNGMVARVPGSSADMRSMYYATTKRAEQAVGRKLRPSEVSRYYYGKAWQFIISEPVRAFMLTLRKLHLFWSHWEISNNKDIYFWTERFTPVVRYLPLGFAIVGPLGILGLLLCRSRASDLFPLWGFTLIYMLSVVIFFCTARYRVPILPPLILLGTQAVLWLTTAVREANARRIAGALTVLITATLFVMVRPGPETLGDDESSYQTLAAAYEKHGELDLAIENYRQALRCDQNPKDPDIPTRLAYVLAMAGRISQAEAAVRRALEIDPIHPQANDTLGNILSQQGQYEEAARRFDAAIDAAPSYANAYYGKGVNLMRQERTDEAIAAFETCVRLEPGHGPAHNNLGNLLAEKGRLEDAAPHLMDALRSNPKSPIIHNNLGSVLRDMGRAEEALVHYRVAVKLEPAYAKAYRNLGKLSLQLGRVDAGLSHLRTVVRLQPDDPHVALELAWLLATHPRADVRHGGEAIQLAERACRQIGHEDPRALDVLGAAYAEAGEFREASSTAQRALEALSGSREDALIATITARLRLYQANQPYREPP